MKSYLTIIRELAKTNKYQGIYSLAKELRLKLFNNDTDFTDIQLMFLRYLNYYYSLNMDVSLGEVDEIVLSNDIYEDAYMQYKSNKEKNKLTRKEDVGSNNKKSEGVVSSSKTSKWIFKTPPKNK